MSWVAQNGDVKARALYRIISDALPATVSPLDYSRGLSSDALFYRQFRDGDTDDDELEEYWKALRTLNFNAGFTILLAAKRNLTLEQQKTLTKALVALVVRHNVVSNLDRARLESAAYSIAKGISNGADLNTALTRLREMSPGDEQFRQGFANLAFSKAEHGIARFILRNIEAKVSATGEVSVSGPEHVHIEHIYPQSPMNGARWGQHDRYVGRIGNLTLLARRFNEQIKNADFATKREKAYENSKLMITEALLKYDDWSPDSVDVRQSELGKAAEEIWPAALA
jgi:hypothetical protein